MRSTSQQSFHVPSFLEVLLVQTGFSTSELVGFLDILPNQQHQTPKCFTVFTV